MAEPLEVTPGDLLSHAGRIESIAGQVATAKQAGDVVRLDNGAYGQLCTIVPVLLNGLQDLVIDGIDAAADSLQDTAVRLRTAAQSYQSTDQRSATSHDRVRKFL